MTAKTPVADATGTQGGSAVDHLRSNDFASFPSDGDALRSVPSAT